MQDLGTTQDIMNFLFATMASVALFLCFFSLMASMVTNIREQTKEAGVLRALGLTCVPALPCRLCRGASPRLADPCRRLALYAGPRA